MSTIFLRAESPLHYLKSLDFVWQHTALIKSYQAADMVSALKTHMMGVEWQARLACETIVWQQNAKLMLL